MTGPPLSADEPFMPNENAASIPADKPEPDEVVRPWGEFLQYANNRPCTVSLMRVKPGMRLSLQSHNDRAELWIALDEGAQVQVGDDVWTCRQGEEIWIPANTRHRLAGVGEAPARVLEIAFGDWKQDDITRYEDDFGRPAEGE